MGRFRKKAVAIEAELWNPDDEMVVERMRQFLGSGYFNHGGVLRVETSVGLVEVFAGEWVIRGEKGDLYPCARDVFAATYEAMETD